MGTSNNKHVDTLQTTDSHRKNHSTDTVVFSHGSPRRVSLTTRVGGLMLKL